MRHLFVAMTAISALACSGERSATAPTDASRAGWAVRIDLQKQPESGRFQLGAGSLEVTPGDNATIWHPELVTTGSFRLSAGVTHLDSGLHPHGAGLAFGGTDIDGPNQRYGYFLVRGDRHFLIKTRNGGETVDVVPWTRSEAIAPEDDKFVTHNLLAVEGDGDETRFWINGVIVHRTATASMPTAGRCGFRLVHDLHVRFGPLTLAPVGR